MDIFQLIKERRSIPRFTSDPVPREVVERMLEAATWAPNHHLTEPWEFVVLEGNAKEYFAEIRRRFRLTLFPDPAAPEAQKAAQKVYQDTLGTPVIIVVTTCLSADPTVAEEDYAATFCGIQNMLLVAASARVGTYPRTGGLVHNPALRAFLEIPPDRRIAAIVYVGYPALIPERRRTPYGQKTRWLTNAPLPAPVGTGPSNHSGAYPGTANKSCVAIDPVCKMEVDIPTARYIDQYEGTTYYFCASRCKAEFEANPAAYVSRSV